MKWQKTWLILWTGSALAVSIAGGTNVSRYELARTLGHPTLLNPAGYDAFGRGLLPLVLKASLLSLGFSFAIVLVSTVIAISSGAALALAPKAASSICLRGLEALLAFPALIFALGWAAIRGPGWSTLIVALLLGVLPGFVRLLYLRAHEVLTEDYIEAAVGLGADRSRILLRHIAPELFRLSAVKLPALFAETLLAEATLSFLGVGAPIGEDTWGSLLAQSKDYLIEAPHLAIATGIPLVLTILALQGISERWELRGARKSG